MEEEKIITRGDSKNHVLYERRASLERKPDEEIVRKKEGALMEGAGGGRNQSASHYLLSGALQHTDEIIKNPIAALQVGMTERRGIHSWTGRSN